MPSLYSLKRQIIDIGKRMYARGMVAANDGNISARVDEKRVLITPTGISKGFMHLSELVLMDRDGKILAGEKKPTSELEMHLAVYRKRPDVHAVCHAHPPYATAHAVAGIALDTCVLSEVITALGSIPIVPYATPGTSQLQEALLPYLEAYDAFLLENHGALTVGKNLTEAWYKMETLEQAAHINFISHALGTPHILNDEQLTGLLKQRERFGVRTPAVCKTSDRQEAIGKPSLSATSSEKDKIERLVQQIVEHISNDLTPD